MSLKALYLRRKTLIPFDMFEKCKDYSLYLVDTDLGKMAEIDHIHM